MKFNEGYWLRKESVQPSYATQGFTVEKIENGMRITAGARFNGCKSCVLKAVNSLPVKVWSR